MGRYNITVLDLYDLRGQSNMDWNSATNSGLGAYDVSQTGVRTYWKTDRTSTDNGNWQTLTPGTNSFGDPAQVGSGYYGIESKLLKDLKDAGKNPYMVKSSIGGTAIGTHVAAGANGIVSNNYYLKPAVSKLAKDGIVRHRGLVWFQGYSDCTSTSNANAYAGQLNTWASDCRGVYASLFIGQVEFSLVVVESPDFTDGVVSTDVDIVQATQLAFGALRRDNYSVSKPTSINFRDAGTHIDGASGLAYSDKILATISTL